MQNVNNDHPTKCLVRRLTGIASLMIVSACSQNNGTPFITTDTCLSMGGTIVGDPGDGSVLRPEFLCPSGHPPIGTIQFMDEEPIAVEGAVCCLS